MEVPKLIILLCCSYYCFASQHGNTIPIEHYEAELQNLGEHVEYPEPPIKVVKITKTVAVKIPVPYPVKVIEKVPYPVHVNKPYPVPVPQIIKVPHHVTPGGQHGHEPLGDQQLGGYQGNAYQVQEIHAREDAPYGDSYEPGSQTPYSGGGSGNSQNYGTHSEDHSSEGSPGNSYDSPSHSYYGDSGPNDAESFESKSYDQAIKEYVSKINSNGNTAGLNNYGYR